MNRNGLEIIAMVVVALASSPRAAHAQSKPPGAAQSEIDRAVSLAHEGRTLYENGKFALALERFRAADRIAHSPVLSLYVARCERNLSHLVAARDAYRIAASEVLGADAPPPFVAAKADATRELSALEPRIPRVKIEAPGVTAVTRVLLDGVVVDVSSREPLWVDPGDHVLSRNDGGVPTTRSFRAVESSAVLVVELPAPSAAPSSTPPARASGEASDEGGNEPTLVPGVIVLGVGVAALAVGVATGLVAASKTSDIEAACVDGRCPASQQSAADSAYTFATVSTVSFIVAGAATAAGIVLLVTLGSDDEEATATRQHIEIAPTAGGARGTWVF